MWWMSGQEWTKPKLPCFGEWTLTGLLDVNDRTQVLDPSPNPKDPAIYPSAMTQRFATENGTSMISLFHIVIFQFATCEITLHHNLKISIDFTFVQRLCPSGVLTFFRNFQVQIMMIHLRSQLWVAKVQNSPAVWRQKHNGHAGGCWSDQCLDTKSASLEVFEFSEIPIFLPRIQQGIQSSPGKNATCLPRIHPPNPRIQLDHPLHCRSSWRPRQTFHSSAASLGAALPAHPGPLLAHPRRALSGVGEPGPH